MMRLFPREPKIDEESGFSKHDIFQRKDFAAGLTSLVKNSSDSLVIALDGGWGTGKTTFLKMWAVELRKQNFPVIVFDAFKHDYIDDAFSAIAGAIFRLAEKKDAKTSEKFGKVAIQAGKVILRSSLKVGVKLATAGLLDLDEAEKAIADEASSAFDKHLGELITKQKDQENTLEAFREALTELASELGNDEPLVFIIDELDRCRPDFALETLERIKHFFSVPNVRFVLSVNMKQLQSSVSARYGLVDDTQTYLEKFIHFRVTFPEVKNHERDGNLQRYVHHLCDDFSISESNRDWEDVIKPLLTHFFAESNWNMRLLQRIVGHLNLIIHAHNQRLSRCRALVVTLCCLKATNEKIYEKARAGRLSFPEAEKALHLDREFPNNSYYNSLFSFYFDESASDEIKNEFRLMGLNGDGPSTVPWVANNFIDTLSTGLD